MSTNSTISRIIADAGVDARLQTSSEDASVALDRSLPRAEAQRLVSALRAAGIEASEAPDQDDRSRSWVHVTVAEANSYRVEVRGSFGGTVGGWRPAITGTLNQTGRSDEEASRFANSDEADEAVTLCVAEGARREDLRIVAI